MHECFKINIILLLNVNTKNINYILKTMNLIKYKRAFNRLKNCGKYLT